MLCRLSERLDRLRAFNETMTQSERAEKEGEAQQEKEGENVTQLKIKKRNDQSFWSTTKIRCPRNCRGQSYWNWWGRRIKEIFVIAYNWSLFLDVFGYDVFSIWAFLWHFSTFSVLFLRIITLNEFAYYNFQWLNEWICAFWMIDENIDENDCMYVWMHEWDNSACSAWWHKQNVT